MEISFPSLEAQFPVFQQIFFLLFEEIILLEQQDQALNFGSQWQEQSRCFVHYCWESDSINLILQLVHDPQANKSFIYTNSKFVKIFDFVSIIWLSIQCFTYCRTPNRHIHMVTSNNTWNFSCVAKVSRKVANWTSHVFMTFKANLFCLSKGLDKETNTNLEIAILLWASL